MTFLSVPRGQPHSNSKPIMPSIVGTPPPPRCCCCFSWRRAAAQQPLVQRDNPRYTKAYICCCSEMPCARSLSMCAQRQHPSAQMNHHCCPPTMQFFCMRIRKEARTHLCVVIASQSLLLWRSTKTQMQNFALEALILDVRVNTNFTSAAASSPKPQGLKF
jgi:hypothetical protein